MSEPTKSGDKPLTENDLGVDETQAALDKQADAEAQIAEDHLLPKSADQISREEYDRIGKGPDYEPKDWGPGTRPDDRTHPGTETAVAGRQQDRQQAKALREGAKAERAEDREQNKTERDLAKEQAKDARDAAKDDAPQVNPLKTR